MVNENELRDANHIPVGKRVCRLFPEMFPAVLHREDLMGRTRKLGHATNSERRWAI